MVLNYLGYMLADKGNRLTEALKMIRKAVELEPMNGAYLDSLGWAYFKLGQYELAEDNLRQAVERDQTDPTVHDHLGDLYEKTGRIRLAAAQWEMSLSEFSKSAARRRRTCRSRQGSKETGNCPRPPRQAGQLHRRKQTAIAQFCNRIWIALRAAPHWAALNVCRRWLRKPGARYANFSKAGRFARGQCFSLGRKRFAMRSDRFTIKTSSR